MAHVAHFKASDIKRLQNEYERDEKYKCRDGRIDSNKTNLNYKMDVESLDKKFNKRFSEVKHSNRKDLNVLSDWVITCPQELQTASEQAKFFQLSYEFVKARYGADNVLQGYVHRDETSPHMHIPVIPVKDNRVSSKALFTRMELHSFHKDLDKIMEDEFNIRGLVLNGRTKGNYTVSELKERTKQEQALQQANDDVQIEMFALQQRDAQLDMRENDLKAQIEDFNQQQKDFALEKLKWRNKANNELEELKKHLEATAKVNYEKQVEVINKWASDYKNQLDVEFQRREDAREAQFKASVESAVERRLQAEQQDQNRQSTKHRGEDVFGF